MTIDELIAELTAIKERNREPDVPNYDPGTLEVRVQSCDGTFDSEITTIETLSDVWLFVDEPDYDL